MNEVEIANSKQRDGSNTKTPGIHSTIFELKDKSETVNQISYQILGPYGFKKVTKTEAKKIFNSVKDIFLLSNDFAKKSTKRVAIPTANPPCKLTQGKKIKGIKYFHFCHKL
jgi:hypothetical protein